MLCVLDYCAVLFPVCADGVSPDAVKLSFARSSCLQAWLAANHSVEETQAEMARLQDLADAVVNISEPRVTFRLIQVRAACCMCSGNEHKSHNTFRPWFHLQPNLQSVASP